MKQKLIVLTKHNEKLPVSWIDFNQKNMMVQKDLPEKNTHITYLYSFDEVKVIKGKRILEKIL